MFLLPTWKALSVVFAYLSLANLLFAVWHRKLRHNHNKGQEYPVSAYSYHGHDYPRVLPSTDTLRSVLLTVEESSSYQIAGYESDPQWEAVGGAAWGYVRLKPNNSEDASSDSHGKRRMFSITMFHELHCLRLLNLAFDESDAVGEHHITHCLNYLRQMALCDSDLTLEPYDWEERHAGDLGGESEGLHIQGATHVCRDWTQVMGLVEENWHEWVTEGNLD
ncbi:hypothetical protein AAF712_014021 [Marasmius tenuissimus]|uniref:Oxidase ustYa n=1 Tax=Marasmius tenuissimus TaxID=585030 RepID=A0ABR2ZD44_9AGAR|nr:hypothetical protein PM082_020881 [Marasmius tenuissimus]